MLAERELEGVALMEHVRSRGPGQAPMLHELRHWEQLPVWVSGDGARLVRWVREHCGVERREHGNRRPPWHFGWDEAHRVLFPGSSGPLPQDHPERLATDAVLRELRAINLLGDGGWFAYKLRLDMAALVVPERPPLEVVR